jgi:hypothetical protein
MSISIMDKTVEPVGRPSKFTFERRESILISISKRLPYKLAAYSNGVTERILYIWLNQGIDDIESGIESDFSQFFHDLKEIECNRVVEHLGNIAERPERWQADAWLLERRWREFFSADSFEQEVRDRLEKLEKIKMKGESNEKSKVEERNDCTSDDEKRKQITFCKKSKNDKS